MYKVQKKKLYDCTLLTTIAAIGVAVVFTETDANAQDIENAGEDDVVVVTGSRIPRAGIETLQPATTLDSETLELRGTINVADALNEQVGFGVPGNSLVGDQDGDLIGANIVDFLGLGSARTLTLVNGMRFVPASSGGLSVDLNAIPEALIDRVETIAIGGAPIYGTDAIAGTVNIILKDDFEGFDFVGSYGVSPEFGDAEEYRIGAVWGRSVFDGRGNIAIGGEYSSVDGLREADRPLTSAGLGFEAPEDPASPFSQILITDPTVAVDSISGGPLFFGDIFFFNVFGNGIPLDITDPASPLSQFDADGNLLPFVPGGGTGGPIFQSGGDGLDLNELSTLGTDLERFHGNLLFNYDVNDRIKFRAEGWYARSKGIEIVEQPNYNSPAFGGLPNNGWGNVGDGPIPVLLSNPFLPTATSSAIGAALDVVHDFNSDGFADPTIDTNGDGVPDEVGFWRFGSLNSIQGDARGVTTRNTFRGVLGLEGDFDIQNRNFYWDIGYAYGRTSSNNSNLNILQANFDRAVRVIDDGSGNAVCQDPSNGCVPLNVVGRPTQEAIDYVTYLAQDKTQIEQHYIAANIGGELFDLPAGPIGFVGGVAYRDESFDFNPNDTAENGLSRFVPVAQNGSFNSKEAYGEFLIPVLGGALDTPLVERLEIESAFRFVDNSVAGSDITWTAGGRYEPVQGFVFRGNVTESIRAPSLIELFTPVSQVFQFADDPCDARFIGLGNVPATRAANCATQGITQPFTSFIVNASQSGTNSGNPNLGNETAKSWTAGLVLQPTFLDRFTATIDWLDIDVAGAIETLTIEDLLNACYDSAAFPAEPACGQFTRDAAGQVIDFQEGFVNVGNISFSGLQTMVTQDFSLGRRGDLNVSIQHLYTNNRSQTSGAENVVDSSGEIGDSKHRINASAVWRYNKLTLFNQIRWLSGAAFDATEPDGFRDFQRVGDWINWDAAVAYDVHENVTLQVNIDNVMNTDPPFPATASAAGLFTYYPSILGRYVTFTVRARF